MTDTTDIYACIYDACRHPKPLALIVALLQLAGYDHATAMGLCDSAIRSGLLTAHSRPGGIWLEAAG